MDAIGNSFCIEGTLLLDGILKKSSPMERRILVGLTQKVFGVTIFD